MHHFDPKLEPEVRKARERFIESREKQLQSLSTTANETAIKYLFTTNAGGAIGVLAFLGAIAEKPVEMNILKYSLALFFIGIILVGIYKAFLVHVFGGIFKEYRVSVKNYFSEEKEWNVFLREIEAQVKLNNIPYYILGYSSFFCFIAGSVLGVLGIIK